MENFKGISHVTYSSIKDNITEASSLVSEDSTTCEMTRKQISRMQAAPEYRPQNPYGKNLERRGLYSKKYGIRIMMKYRRFHIYEGTVEIYI